MKVRLPRISSATLWAALFFAILPLAFAGSLEIAVIQGAITQGIADTWRRPFEPLSAPGLALSAVIDESAIFWSSHSEGEAYWHMLSVYVSTNFVGWLIVVTTITGSCHSFKRWLQGRRQRRGRGILPTVGEAAPRLGGL